jgi:VanZ family protein
MIRVNRTGKIVIRGAAILTWLSWMGVMFHFSSKAAWGGAHTLSLLEVLLASSFPALLESLSLQQLEILNLGVRKLAHLTEYGILAWLGFCTWYFGTRWPYSRALLLALLGSVIYAIADEVHQSFVPGRTALLSDVLIDILGVLAALWLIERSPARSLRDLRSSGTELIQPNQK